MTLEWIKILGPIIWPVVVLIAILVFRKPLVALAMRFSDKHVKRVKVGREGIELERAFEQVEERQDRQQHEINAIKIALKGILTKHESGPLQRLNGDEPAVMMKGEPELYGYLHRLDGLNFIQPHKDKGLRYGLFDIVEDHEREWKGPDALPYDKRPSFDLRRYVYITDDGRIYLKTLSDLDILEK